MSLLVAAANTPTVGAPGWCCTGYVVDLNPCSLHHYVIAVFRGRITTIQTTRASMWCWSGGWASPSPLAWCTCRLVQRALSFSLSALHLSNHRKTVDTDARRQPGAGGGESQKGAEGWKLSKWGWRGRPWLLVEQRRLPPRRPPQGARLRRRPLIALHAPPAVPAAQVAQRLGVPMVGVNLPGHFFIAPADPSYEFFVDAFAGGCCR